MLFSVFQIYSTVVSAISIIANAFLLLLSTSKSIDALQVLRYFLANVSVTSIVFSLCNLLIVPQMVVRGTMTIRVPHGFAQHLPEYVVKIIASLAVTSWMYNVLSFPIFFLYRLVILTNNVTYGHYFNKRNMLFTFFVIFLMSVMDGTFFYFSNIDYESLHERLNRTSNALEQFTEAPTNHLQVLFSTTPMPNAPMTSSNGQMQTLNDIALIEAAKNLQKRITLFGDDFNRNPVLLLFLGVAFFGHVLAYVVVLVCSYFMLKALQKKAGQISFVARMSNEVLVHAVFAEAFVPLMFTVPILANSLLCYFYTDSLQWQEYLPEYLVCVVPLLTPLISLLFIQPYRNAALNYITFGQREKKQAADREKKSQEQEDNEAAREILRMNIGA